MLPPDKDDQTKPTKVGSKNDPDNQEPLNETQKIRTQPAEKVDALFKNETPASEPTIKTNIKGEKIKTNKPRRLLWILAGILLILISAGISAYSGYQKAIQQRLDRQANQVIFTAGEQYNLALVDIQNKQWDQARTRLEYVIQLDPSFPGAADQLKTVLLAQVKIATPTDAPTATETSIPGTPTPDLRGVQDYFNQIQQYLNAKDWDNAIKTVYLLRQQNISYKSVEVDGMLFIALRNRGVDEILQKGQLEQGIYDLALAESISPLDAEADSYRTWANQYLYGASYWGVDWQKVVDAFSQIYPALPMLRDGNGYTAQERFRVASIKLGDQLAAAGDFCKAQTHYDAALALSKDAQLQATDQAIQAKCSNAQQASYSPTPIPTFTLGPSWTPSLVVRTTVPVVNTPVPTVNTPVPSVTNTLPPPVPTETPTPPKPTPTVETPTNTTAPTETPTK